MPRSARSALVQALRFVPLAALVVATSTGCLFFPLIAANRGPSDPTPTRTAAPPANIASRAASATPRPVEATPGPRDATPRPADATPVPADGPPTAGRAAPPPVTFDTGGRSISLTEAAERIKGYTVLVEIYNGRGTRLGNGTGIALGGNRVLTNHHVVENGATARVRFADGRAGAARVIYQEVRRDLALLEAEVDGPPGAPLRSSRELQLAEELIAVGYPRADALGSGEMTITRGIFSGLRQTENLWLVQTDAPVNPGNSGGPLADTQGRVVGVVRFIVRGAVGLNFAVSTDEVTTFLENSARGGRGDAPAPRPTPTVGSFVPPPSFATVERALRPDQSPADGGPTRTVGPTRTAAPTRPPAPTRTSTPLPSARAAERAVRQYYERLNARDFSGAWGLLGPEYRATNPYDDWVKGFDTTRQVTVRAAKVVSESGGTAVVEVTVGSTDLVSGRLVRKEFQGAWQLVREGDAWKLNFANLRQTE